MVLQKFAFYVPELASGPVLTCSCN